MVRTYFDEISRTRWNHYVWLTYATRWTLDKNNLPCVNVK